MSAWVSPLVPPPPNLWVYGLPPPLYQHHQSFFFLRKVDLSFLARLPQFGSPSHPRVVLPPHFLDFVIFGEASRIWVPGLPHPVPLPAKNFWTLSFSVRLPGFRYLGNPLAPLLPKRTLSCTRKVRYLFSRMLDRLCLAQNNTENVEIKQIWFQTLRRRPCLLGIYFG